MAAQSHLPVVPEASSPPFSEIDITNDLRAMAALDGEARWDDEAEWVDDSSSPSTPLFMQEAGQIDIRSYFRPLPKEDIRIYFHPISTPRPADRPKQHQRPRLSITVPKVRASYNITHQANGPIMSRSRPPAVPPKVRSSGQRNGEIFERNQREGNIRGPGHRQHHQAAMTPEWHPTWTDEGLRAFAYQISPRVGEVVDYSLLPHGLKPAPARHSPTLSEDETLVSSRPDSDCKNEDLYSVLPVLPIRLAKKQDFSPPDYYRHRGREHPYSPDDINGGSTSPYASSEALPAESRPTGVAALQLWADEQRRNGAQKPAVPPKKSPKRRRQVLQSGEKNKLDIATKERLELNRYEDRKSLTSIYLVYRTKT